MNAVYGLPKNVLTYPDWKTKFCEFLEMYKDDLPQPRFLDTELEMWAERCQMEKGPLPSKLPDVLLFVDKISFSNTYTAFQIFATIPVTTCTCERSISVLRRLKTLPFGAVQWGSSYILSLVIYKQHVCMAKSEKITQQ